MNRYYEDYYPEFSENPHLDESPHWVKSSYTSREELDRKCDEALRRMNERRETE